MHWVIIQEAPAGASRPELPENLIFLNRDIKEYPSNPFHSGDAGERGLRDLKRHS